MKHGTMSSRLKLPDKDKNNLVHETFFVKEPVIHDVYKTINNLRIKNISKIIIATLNVNSIRGKFEQLKTIISGNIDILVITESKIDESFPSAQFLLDGFSPPYILDRNKYGGVILIYVREYIPSKILKKYKSPDDKKSYKKQKNFVYEKIISEDNEVSESFNNFFRDAVKQLDIQENLHLLNKSNNTDNLIEYAIEKFESHSSILKIKEKVNSSLFNFRNVSLVDVEKDVKSLNPKKANTTNSIPSNLLKQHFDNHGPTLHNLVNETFQENIFPEELKLADITQDDAINVCKKS